MVYIYQNFFIHSLVNGHLSWFHIFTIVNCVNYVCKCVFHIMTSFPLSRYLVVELLDRMVGPLLARDIILNLEKSFPNVVQRL